MFLLQAPKITSLVFSVFVSSRFLTVQPCWTTPSFSKTEEIFYYLFQFPLSSQLLTKEIHEKSNIQLYYKLRGKGSFTEGSRVSENTYPRRSARLLYSSFAFRSKIRFPPPPPPPPPLVWRHDCRGRRRDDCLSPVPPSCVIAGYRKITSLSLSTSS